MMASGEVNGGDPQPASCRAGQLSFDYIRDGDKGVSAAPCHVFKVQAMNIKTASSKISMLRPRRAAQQDCSWS
jgi:hypothetical protein